MLFQGSNVEEGGEGRELGGGWMSTTCERFFVLFSVFIFSLQQFPWFFCLFKKENRFEVQLFGAGLLKAISASWWISVDPLLKHSDYSGSDYLKATHALINGTGKGSEGLFSCPRFLTNTSLKVKEKLKDLFPLLISLGSNSSPAKMLKASHSAITHMLKTLPINDGNAATYCFYFWSIHASEVINCGAVVLVCVCFSEANSVFGGNSVAFSTPYGRIRFWSYTPLWCNMTCTVHHY